MSNIIHILTREAQATRNEYLFELAKMLYAMQQGAR